MDGFAEFVLATAAFAAASAGAMLVSVRRRARAGRSFGWKLEARRDNGVSVCRDCGYSLAGLKGLDGPEGVECPECGVSSLDRRRRVLMVDPGLVRRWWLVLVIYIGSWLVLEPGAHWALIRAYGRDGIDAERAERWILLREFGRNSELHVGVGELMFPVLVVAGVVFPLLILLKGAWWWRLMVVLWPVGYCVSLWRIAVFC